MKKSIWLWGIAFILIGLAAFITNEYNLSEPELVQASALTDETADATDPTLEQALDFTLLDLEGTPVSLSDLRGKNVYLNFWATWCKWCVHEMPDMEKAFQAYERDDLIVLAIAVGEDQTKVANYLADYDYSFRFLLDEDKSVTRAYGVKSIPVSLLIDKGGNVVYKRVGAMNEEQITNALGLLP